MRVGIVGATGWLGSALGTHLLARGIVAAGDLVLLNRSGRQGGYAGHKGVVWARDLPDLVARSDIVVLSVRPEDWPGLDLRAEGRLVLSFIAGVAARSLGTCGGRIVRAMPNAAAEIGASYSPWWAAADVTAADRAAVTLLLSAIGSSDTLPDEAQIDVMSALPGSGAAYPALMAVAMADHMRAQGLPDHIAWRAAEAVVCDGARLLAGRIAEAPAMIAAYRDYRGPTAAGIEAAEAAGFTRAIAAALDAATAKSQRMAAE